MKIANFLASVALLVAAAGCAYNQRQAGYGTVPTSGEIISSPPPVSSTSVNLPVTEADGALAEQVRQQFNRYGVLAAAGSNIEVSARNGTVTLTGTVPSEQERKMVDAMVQNTSGVTAVNDRLKVGVSPTASNHPAGSVGSRVRDALKNQPAVAGVAPNVQVSEQNGTVTLTGTVPAEEDRRLIESVAKSTSGVVAVNNNLQIAPQPTGRTAATPGDIFNLHVQGLSAPDRTLAQRILEGLQTDTVIASLIPTVNINVASGKVMLQGTVQSEQQRRAIVSTVQRAAGAENVEDNLQVQVPQ